MNCSKWPLGLLRRPLLKRLFTKLFAELFTKQPSVNKLELTGWQLQWPSKEDRLRNLHLRKIFIAWRSYFHFFVQAEFFESWNKVNLLLWEFPKLTSQANKIDPFGSLHLLKKFVSI